MTWIASGVAFGSQGTALDDGRAIAAAFAAAIGSAEAAGQRLLVEGMQPTIGRAVGRWLGEDQGATPLFSRREARGSSPLQLQIGRSAASADPGFCAFVVPAGTDEMTVTLVDDGSNSSISTTNASLSWRLPMAEPASERTYVLLDAFVGDNTTRQTFLSKVTNGVATIRLRLRGQAAVALGTRIRVFADERTARDTDPTWIDRLQALERHPAYSILAEQHPRLEDAPSDTAPIAVLVHGTFSSCVPSLAEISHLVNAAALYRFEHDTLRPVAENAEELVAELERIDSTGVTLIGHSRGGLVATMAAKFAPAVRQVLTLGTPHNGTPIAAAGDNMLGYAVATLATQYKSMVEAGLRAAHLGSILPDGHLPDGWTDMLPSSSFIRLLRCLPRENVTAYGGTFDGAGPGLGVLPAIAADAMSILMAGPNDLVVPLSSSHPAELSGEELRQVHHFGYFMDPIVQDAIARAVKP